MAAANASRRILHCDMDAFYAAVHLRDDPALRGLPVVVGGRPEERGVVAAASYEARRFGIHSAMPSAQALRRCPQAVILEPDFRRYRRESRRIFTIFRDFTPLVQTVALDEAYLDLSEHWMQWGSATAAAQALRARVREETGLTVSVGVSCNRLLAKIASDFDKPDGLTVVRPEAAQAFLDPLPVRRLPGVGPATERRLQVMGVETIADLRALPRAELVARFGKVGSWFHRAAHGEDERPVEVERPAQSVSTERTWPITLRDPGPITAALARQAHEVAGHLERRGLSALTLTLKLRYPDYRTITRSTTLRVPTRDPARIEVLAGQLLERTEARRRGVRLLGLATSNFVTGPAAQLELFDA